MSVTAIPKSPFQIGGAGPVEAGLVGTGGRGQAFAGEEFRPDRGPVGERKDDDGGRRPVLQSGPGLLHRRRHVFGNRSPPIFGEAERLPVYNRYNGDHKRLAYAQLFCGDAAACVTC